MVREEGQAGGRDADLTTVLLLAAVLWLDGWRITPRESLVLRKTGLGEWRVVEPWARTGAFALLALWPPLGVPVVVMLPSEEPRAAPTWASDFGVALARARRRLRRTRVQVGALRGIGSLLIAWIVVGIPLATARSGLHGLLFGILGAFCLSTWLAIVVFGTVRELGGSWRGALRASASLISPFAAVRAPEVVIDAALGGAPALARAAALLGDEGFAAWLRPHAYDADQPHAETEGAGPIRAAVLRLPRRILDEAIAVPAGGAGDAPESRYCPRCAGRYTAGVDACGNCPGVALCPLP